MPSFVHGYLASATRAAAPRAPASPYPPPTKLPISLRRLEPNPAMRGVSGLIRVSGVDSIPGAVNLARKFATRISLAPEDVTLIEVVPTLTEQAVSPTGTVQRWRSENLILDRAPGFTRIQVTREAGEELPETSIEIPAEPWTDPRLGPVLERFPSLFVGGLVSISAEPPEGFFAASTAAEMAAAGFPLSPASAARAWLYRVPDSRPQSYFEFSFPSPDRPADGPRHDKFKIATGLGPLSNPASQGGQEADLLWLGDEYHGSLTGFLGTLARPDLRLSHLGLHAGFVLKLPDGSVVLGHADRSHGLTRAGFEALKTEPELYRKVYSEDYDRFLASLFEPMAEPAQATYLLATSRGCTQGCAICCSGGLKPFQFFSAKRMLEELTRLYWHSSRGLIDVYFVDSNFNNHAGRLIEFAERYRKSRLYGKFRFFVRHNTVNGFLHPGAPKTPNVELLDAFRTLGIHEIWMGVDTYDDASTLTLKSHRKLLAAKGAQARPTYTFAELAALIEAMEERGLTTKGFYLRNNPWVSDFDRIDSWFNLFGLWLANPHFSIDSRDPDINRLKPFAGSPITEAAERLDLPVVRGGRFVAFGQLGELDEQVDVTGLGQPRVRADVAAVLERFAADMERLRQKMLFRGTWPLLQKLMEREQAFLPVLDHEAPAYAERIREFAARWGHLGAFDTREQDEAFRRQSASLVDGLAS